jgi:hypothetical protein
MFEIIQVYDTLSSQICDTSVTDVAMGDDENQEEEDEPVPGTPPAKRVSL